MNRRMPPATKALIESSLTSSTRIAAGVEPGRPEQRVGIGADGRFDLGVADQAQLARRIAGHAADAPAAGPTPVKRPKTASMPAADWLG